VLKGFRAFPVLIVTLATASASPLSPWLSTGSIDWQVLSVSRAAHSLFPFLPVTPTTKRIVVRLRVRNHFGKAVRLRVSTVPLIDEQGLAIPPLRPPKSGFETLPKLASREIALEYQVPIDLRSARLRLMDPRSRFVSLFAISIPE
jgi:hypothetical protein